MDDNEVSIYSRIISFVWKFLPFLKPSIFKALQGEWDYDCIVAEGADFPYPKGSGNSHGGTITISMKKRVFYTKVRVEGNRTWQYIKDNTGKLAKETLKNPIHWKAEEGAFISNSKIMYKYLIPHEPIIGVTFLNLEYDKGRKQFIKPPEGEFYYIPNSSVKPGSVFEALQDGRKRKNFGKIWGMVRYSNYRKREF